jgi:2-pyrone-4,6-dicarboxylate lactonase
MTSVAQLLDTDGIPICVGPNTVPRKPKLKAPAGAIDCHAHIFGPVSRYPFSPKRLFTPPDVTLAQYRELLSTLGIENAVLVTPSVYGMDNERQLDALNEMKGCWRGVAVVPTDVATTELERLHAGGFRGVRVNWRLLRRALPNSGGMCNFMSMRETLMK